MKNQFQEGKPENYESLKRDANNQSDWRKRKAAVQELSKWKCRESIDILWRRMMSDKVYSIQETAFRGLQAFGEKVHLPRKAKGNLIKGINADIAKVKNSLIEGHSFEEFKEAFKVKKPVEYDTYEGDLGGKFDSWLKNVWTSAPKKK